MRLALSTQEKFIAPSLKLHNSVSVLNNYQKNLGKQIRHNKVVAKKEIKVKENKFKKEFNKLVDPRFQKKSVKEKEETNICTTKHLSRIMICFEDEEFSKKPLSISDIKDFTLLPNNIINDGLKFLTNYKIITEINDRGNYFYTKNVLQEIH